LRSGSGSFGRRPHHDLVDDRPERVDQARVVAALPDQARRADGAGGIDMLAATHEIVGQRVRRGADPRARVDAVDLALAHERGRAPGVDPLPLHRLGDFVAPEGTQMLEPPVREIAVDADRDLDPFAVRVIERGAVRRGVDVQDARLAGLHRTKIRHAWTIAERWREA